jgi:hypothetical protein
MFSINLNEKWKDWGVFSNFISLFGYYGAAVYSMVIAWLLEK